MTAASVERNANRLDMPLSLRIIKRKKRWERELMEAQELACCSCKKAFSSMVFIVRELQSHALHMRSDDDQPPPPGILDRVRSDLHASFVWLFQRVFCCTPTLMLYLMILLANFTVYSMGCNPATAIPPSQSLLVDVINIDDHHPSAVSQLQDETIEWNKFVEDALRMRASTTDEALMDPDVLRQFVAPVSVHIQPEEDNSPHYINTELMYERALSEDPDNALLLSNFAQFLYLVHHNYDRAEYYFERAVEIQPTDAEALNRYACFLWLVRKDLGAAEETFLEAIAADPGNLVYASNYSHFIWKTGGKETCFPILDNPDAY
ncbi:putative tetratricopeptide-like helical domain superfamily [Dioscorea sansibarensis]